MLGKDQLESLNVIDKEGARQVSVGANLCLYIEPPLDEIAEEILSVYDMFLQICPKEQLVWFLTNSMERHEPVTKRTLGMPKTWFYSKRKKRTLMSFELKNSIGKYYSDAPDWKFRFFSRSRDNRFFPERANYIEFLFPTSFLDDGLSTFNDFVQSVSHKLPFLSGHAGYTFEVSKYYENTGAFDKALSLSMRYKEIDISEPKFESVVKKNLCIKGINWLTLLGEGLATQIKASSGIKYDNLSFREIDGKLIVQAGERPVVADGNRGETSPAYREAYALLLPIIVKNPIPLSIEGEFGDKIEKTLEWIHRFK